MVMPPLAGTEIASRLSATRPAHRIRMLITTGTYPPGVTGAASFTHRPATGLPVVAADAMAPPHRPDETGFLRDVPARARHLLTSARKRPEMGRAARRIAMTHDHQASPARPADRSLSAERRTAEEVPL